MNYFDHYSLKPFNPILKSLNSTHHFLAGSGLLLLYLWGTHVDLYEVIMIFTTFADFNFYLWVQNNRFGEGNTTIVYSCSKFTSANRAVCRLHNVTIIWWWVGTFRSWRNYFYNFMTCLTLKQDTNSNITHFSLTWSSSSRTILIFSSYCFRKIMK